MKRKVQIVATILIFCLGMSLFSNIAWETGSVVKAASDVLYTEGQPVESLDLNRSGRTIEFTEENAEIDITSWIPDNVEWKYYHHMEVNYEIKYAENSAAEADNGDINRMEGKIQFVHKNLYNSYPEYLCTKYKCTVEDDCNGEMSFVMPDRPYDFSDFENADDKMYIMSLKAVDVNKIWVKKVKKVVVTSIRVFSYGDVYHANSAPTGVPTTAPPITAPTEEPTMTPTETPTRTPTATPTMTPTVTPAATPTVTPTATPTGTPAATPTGTPTAIPTVIPTATPTEEPTVTPTVPPTEVPTQHPAGSSDVSKPPALSSDVPKLEAIQQFKANVYKRKFAKLRWRSVNHADGYEIYRSVKKNSGFQKIATVSKQKSDYIDKKIKRLHVYFYRIRPYCLQNGKRTYGKYSSSINVLLKQKEPSYLLTRKKTSRGISYIHIVLKKWSDSCVAIWVKSGKKGYVRIPLPQPNIKKKKGIYNFKYSKDKGKLYFKICTYKKGKKGIRYSFSKIKGI